MSDASDEGSRPPFDAVRASSLIGKYVLVGLTYEAHDGQVIEQTQIHGTIVRADERHGFAIQLRGERDGEVFWLPPDLGPFSEAQPGEYRLRSTGEVVTSPDLLAMWTVTKPAPKDSE